MNASTRKWAIAGVVILAVLVLLAGTWLIASVFFAANLGPQGGFMGAPGQGAGPFQNRSYASNGAQIYNTGTSQSGPPITFEMPGGGGGMPMMQGRLACADCHGPNGQGGTVNMMMSTVQAPNIQYEHLTSGEHDEGGESHPPYTDETIKRAITQGVDPAGDPLEWPMPRWNMTDAQLNDLLAYLKTLK